ncbi:MarR family winged helix-turn-helix transcriptional regulator [Microbacterium sp. SORGH_AS_0862]|uniref:MarR family winged helix-turn-helix transcriptional regulator n=1 Tax=Microbacterium sp. SORGH_AS_0862 TaxID=3041789 RepID=UPI0027D78ACD|nr:MarR family transcriptional regulator [Microbacterium sp. SORGH_AS_0862]
MTTWLPLIRLVQLLPQALDRRLRDEGGINHAHYAILVTLAGSFAQPATMTDLARIAGLSRSRLSHAIDALERRGWVERTTCGSDGRTQSARLTDAGWDILRQAAPAHVEQIRSLVLDRLDDSERTALATIAAKLVPGVEDAL